MKVPFVDLGAEYRELRGEIDEAIRQVIAHSQFIGGPPVEAFEREFARFLGVEHCVGVSSGTDALRLALEALGVGPGDEVLVPANTFAATALAVAARGATPRFVDCEERHLLLDPARVAAALTPRTKAIIPVHLYGRVLDVAALRGFGLPILEDAAQAHGAHRQGVVAGTQGELACFSFYPSKNLGAYGDAGAIVTRDPELRDRLRLLRHYGEASKGVHLVRGYNARLDGLQAAILSVKLRHLEAANRRRREAARFYDERLEVRRLEFDPGHAYHLYVVRLRDRDAVRARLAEAGVQTLIHYPTPLHLQPCFRDLDHAPGSFPVAERAAQEILSLPLYPQITREQLNYVVEVVNREAETA